MTFRTTEKDFELFQTTAQSWIDRFGLQDWEVVFKHNDDIPDVRAACQTSDMLNRICYITLAVSWQSKPDNHGIRQAAFHEVLELLLMPLRIYLMGIPGVSEDYVDGECHRIIRIMENTFCRKEESKVKRSARGK